MKNYAASEAEWLFANYKTSICHMTGLTEVLSRRINDKNEAVSEFLSKHPEMLDKQVILDHLPSLFTKNTKTVLNVSLLNTKKQLLR